MEWSQILNQAKKRKRFRQTTFQSKCKPWKVPEARRLRKNPTESEARLWNNLRMKQLGFKFRRQHLILGYIVDFYCPSAHLVIEVDGPSHSDKKDVDIMRDRILNTIAIKTIRFTNSEVMNDINNVLIKIKEEATKRDRRPQI